MLEKLQKTVESNVQSEQNLLRRIALLEQELQASTFEREKNLREANDRLVARLRACGIPEEEINSLLEGASDDISATLRG